jgi:hypothetical protein
VSDIMTPYGEGLVREILLTNFIQAKNPSSGPSGHLLPEGEGRFLTARLRFPTCQRKVKGSRMRFVPFNSFAEVSFQFRITPGLMVVGLAFAMIMGTIGGLLPAQLAARIPIVRGLRT